MVLSATQHKDSAQLIRDGFFMEEITTAAFVHTRYAKDNEMLWIHEGSGTLHINDVTFLMAPGTLFLIGRGQSWVTDIKSKAKAIHLVFGDCFWDRTPVSARNCKATLYGDIRAHQHLVPIGEGGENIYRILKDMLLEFQRAAYSNQADVLAAYLKILIIKIANVNEELSLDTNNHHYKIYQQFTEILQAHFAHTHHVNLFARQLNISPRKLVDICQLYSNKTPKILISEQLIAEARRLLQFSTMPVKEIAFQLNFSTPYQFSNFFKKHTTIAPQDYRNSFAQIGM